MPPDALRRVGGRTRRLVLLLTVLAATVVSACGTDPTGGDAAGRAGGATVTTTGGGPSRSSRAQPPGSDEVQANATVLRVVDGDTIVADVDGTDERVRFIGVDTPESVKPNSPVECYGKEASAHTRDLLPEGTRVRLVLDAEERDRYGRLLAYVYRASDGLFVNLRLAVDGYAGLMTYPPNVAHVDEFRAAVADARRRRVGLWSVCSSDLPVKG